MMRTAVAGVVGGLVLFLWSFLSWVVLPIHTPTIKQLPQEDTVMSMMRANMPDKGVYYFPQISPSAAKDPAAVEAWTAKYARGPIGFIVYSPEGGAPMEPLTLVVSFILEIAAALFGIWFFRRSTAARSGYFSQAAFFGAIGTLICVAVYLQEWLHMKYPLAYSLAFCADAAFGWFLMGLAIVPMLNAGMKKQSPSGS